MKNGRRLSQPHLGPSISALPLWGTSAGKMIPLLSDKERAHLGRIASLVRFKKNETIHTEGDRATAVFNIRDGVVKICKASRNERKDVIAFLFPGDLTGLAEEEHYANSATAITAVTAYRFPVRALETLLKKDALIEFQVITKLTNSLRREQLHALVLHHRNPINKVALFLQLIEEYELARGRRARWLHLPMNRSDIASYLGLKPETLSRAFAELRKTGTIATRGLRHILLTDRKKFAAALALPD